MILEELEEALADILPLGFKIEVDESGQLIVYTGLALDDDELVDFVGDEDEDEDDEESDPDLEPLDDED